MTDKATPSLRQRCDTALQSLPDAAYKTMLAALFDDLLGLAAQAAPTLLDALKSGKAILIDWPMEPSTPEEALELMDAMDAEYAKTMGKPAPDDEMAVAMRRVRHMACDLWAWQKEAMRANFTALAAAQPSQAPVVQAVQAGELVEQEMAMLIRRLCSTTANDKTRAQAMEYLFKRGRASPLRTESEPAQAMEHPPLPEGVKARFKCEDCGGTGYTGDMIPGSEFQPPEPVGCTSCNFTGWWAECEAYSADQMRAYVDADRASSGATTQAVRMLTEDEQAAIIDMHSTGRAQGDHECAEAIQRKFCEVNKLPAPADGVIGGA